MTLDDDPRPYERKPVAAPPGLVVAKLRELLMERGITEYAVVDHGHDMTAAGSPGFTAWTLIFGDPAVGSELLEAEPAAAVDIPLRLAVVNGDDARSEIVRRDLHSLLPDRVSDLAERFNSVLEGLAEEARERAEADRS